MRKKFFTGLAGFTLSLTAAQAALAGDVNFGNVTFDNNTVVTTSVLQGSVSGNHAEYTGESESTHGGNVIAIESFSQGDGVVAVTMNSGPGALQQQAVTIKIDHHVHPN